MTRSRRLRSAVARVLDAVTDEIRPGAADGPTSIALGDAPSADPRPRWGHGRAAHAQLAEILDRHHDTSRDTLAAMVRYVDDLAKIDRDEAQAGPAEPFWRNPFLPPVDLAALYAFVRDRRPRRYVEIGSGNSTLTVHRAIRDGGLSTEIVSIDPTPRRGIDELCSRIYRQPLERVHLAELELDADDLVFFDGSHRVFTGSDVVIFYLEMLPALAPGTLVGIHDILWPDDYPPEWRSLWFSEQYLLGAYLLGGTPWLRPLLPAYAATQDPDLAAVLEPLWQRIGADLDRRGFAFWAEITDDR